MWQRCLILPTLMISVAADTRIHYSAKASGGVGVEFQSPASRSKRQAFGTTTPTPPNTTVVEVDTHIYYRQLFSANPQEASDRWVDLDNHPGKVVHESLSDAHRTAAVVYFPKNFRFRYYGHELSFVTLATGGFLYVGAFLHQWLTVTQYIAPLMANFDSSINAGEIVYMINSTHAVFEWRSMHLNDDWKAGPFSFQCILHEKGRIDFVYKLIPQRLDEISSALHPVKLGIADAYYTDITRQGLPVRVIHEYHNVTVNLTMIQSLSYVSFVPLPTCLDYGGCGECVTARIPFNCSWCQALYRCGSGMDRNYEQWRNHGCHDVTLYTASSCQTLPTPPKPQPQPSSCGSFRSCSDCVTHPVLSDCRWCDALQRCSALPFIPANWGSNGCNDEPTWTSNTCKAPRAQQSSDSNAVPAGAIVAIIVLLLLIAAIVGWGVFAYMNPESRSGQWLIRNRPSELWRRMKNWRRGGAPEERYAPENSTQA